MIRHILIFTAILAVGRAFGASDTLSSYSVVPQNDAQMEKIAKAYEVVAKKGEGYEVYVAADRVAEFLKLAPQAKLLEADTSAALRAMEHTDAAAGYHNFDEIQTMLKGYVRDYPELVQLTEYGKSKQGKPLMALKLSDNVIDDENEPEVLLTAATHGDEIITVEVLMGILDKMLRGYSTDARLRDIVDKHEIYFIPVLNPDGFVTKTRYDNGVDPNRSYPWPEDPNATPSGAVGPLLKFYASRKFVGSIDFHAFGELIMYPWAYTRSSVGNDEKTFSQVTSAMAAQNGYTAGQISKVIYIAQGSSADYFYWKHGSFSLGIEMASSKAPSSSQIAGILNDNWESTLLFLEHFESPAVSVATAK